MSFTSQPYKGYMIDRVESGWMIFDPQTGEYVIEKEFASLTDAKNYIDFLGGK